MGTPVLMTWGAPRDASNLQGFPRFLFCIREGKSPQWAQMVPKKNPDLK